jgi:hypothetical protein
MNRRAAMNEKTGGYLRLRRGGALAAIAAVAVLATACGASATSSASEPSYAQVLALAQCMRTHGVPDFPDPDSSGGYALEPDGSLEGADGSVDINSSQAQVAYGDCKHLVPGAPSIAQLEQKLQQQQSRRAQMLPQLVKYSQCMRSHGVPNFPSPGESKNPGPVNPGSSQYLAAASACQHLLPAGAHVSVSTSQRSS